MLISKIPVLDKGYVALVSCSNTTQVLRDLNDEFFNGTYPKALDELGTLTLAIKCPLFVQLNLSKFNFRIINETSNNDQANVEAYLPNTAQIGAKERSVCDAISDDIARTTAALLINPAAYRQDGCDKFVAQVMTPLNVYTTLIVHGSYKEWCEFAYVQKVPGPIKAYTMAVQQVMEAEWIKDGKT